MTSTGLNPFLKITIFTRLNQVQLFNLSDVGFIGFKIKASLRDAEKITVTPNPARIPPKSSVTVQVTFPNDLETMSRARGRLIVESTMPSPDEAVGAQKCDCIYMRLDDIAEWIIVRNKGQREVSLVEPSKSPDSEVKNRSRAAILREKLMLGHSEREQQQQQQDEGGPQQQEQQQQKEGISSFLVAMASIVALVHIVVGLMYQPDLVDPVLDAMFVKSFTEVANVLQVSMTDVGEVVEAEFLLPHVLWVVSACVLSLVMAFAPKDRLWTLSASAAFILAHVTASASVYEALFFRGVLPDWTEVIMAGMTILCGSGVVYLTWKSRTN